MAKQQKPKFGAKTQTVDLSRYLNWPDRTPKDEWWQRLAESVSKHYPTGPQRAWGVPFQMAEGQGPRALLVTKDRPEVTVPLKGLADFVCFLHRWEPFPPKVQPEYPKEGLVVAEYLLTYYDGSTHVQPVRARFEVDLPGTWAGPFVAVPFGMPKTVDPSKPMGEFGWGLAQYGLYMGHMGGSRVPLLVCAMPNPNPEKKIKSLTIRGLNKSPLLIGAITLYQGASHPLRHLPRRGYRVKTAGKPRKIEKVEVDLGDVAREEHTPGPRDKAWLKSNYVGMNNPWSPTSPDPTVRHQPDIRSAHASTCANRPDLRPPPSAPPAPGRPMLPYPPRRAASPSNAPTETACCCPARIWFASRPLSGSLNAPGVRGPRLDLVEDR